MINLTKLYCGLSQDADSLPCGHGAPPRALPVHGDLWVPDPACYLADEEIAASHSAN
jgi:hypothetical protein